MFYNVEISSIVEKKIHYKKWFPLNGSFKVKIELF